MKTLSNEIKEQLHQAVVQFVNFLDEDNLRVERQREALKEVFRRGISEKNQIAISRTEVHI